MAKSKSVTPAKRTIYRPCCSQCNQTKKLLNLETARADNAQKQFEDALSRYREVRKMMFEQANCSIKLKDFLAESNRQLVIEAMAGELNMAEYLKADQALKMELLKTAVQQEEIGKRICELTEGLAHSDADRRQLQRDIEAQKKVLDRWGKFDCVSPALRASHAE